MDLLLPPAAPVHLPRRPADSLLFLSPTKTNLSFKRPHQNSSIFFPRLATNVRTATSTLVSLQPSTATATAVAEAAAASPPCSRWVVVMERPQNAGSAKSEIVDYYVRTLARVLPSEKEAQMCIYNASWENDFFFCCDIDEEASRELANIPGVVSVTPDKDLESDKKDYSYANLSLAHQSNSGEPASRFSSSGEKCDYWLVRMEKPGVEVVTKAQMVDYFAHILTKVLGNEKDAQVSIYNISWEKNFGFCCQIDEECARELSDVPGVLSVEPDMNVESENKDYKADDRLLKTKELHDSSETSAVPVVKTKRLFVTGLSFYTSEKTLRASFEPFGELVEVKIIMDKISKRSKGYAFIEYTTEEAAGAALKEMNGKIINGWMIVVDVAKTNPPKYSRGHSRPPSRPSSSY